jgi:hypothetical protein
MKTTQQYTVLPAAIYDALNLSAIANGGIGSGCLDQSEIRKGKIVRHIPVCIIGHTLFLDGQEGGVNTDAGEKPGLVTSAVAKAFGFEPRTYCDVFAKNDTPIVAFLGKRYPGESTVKDVSWQSGTGEFCSLAVEKKLTWRQWTKAVGVVRGGK